VEALIFWILFIIVMVWVMVNLFVLVILNEFSNGYIDSEKNYISNFQMYKGDFKIVWRSLTCENNGVKIHHSMLLEFFLQLSAPLGLDVNEQIRLYIDELKVRRNDEIADDEILYEKQKFRAMFVKLAGRKIMKMNLQCDSQGFIYFHYLFYIVMKTLI